MHGVRERRFAGLTVAIVACVAVVVGCEREPDCTSTGATTNRDIRYAASPGTAARLQSLDLYLPIRPERCGPVPLVAYVHGGAFSAGDKANRIADKVRLFTEAGWAFASLNYRLVGDAGSGSTGGVYPAAEQDVAAAIGYLRTHADDHGLDAHRTLLLGHSAGAFLVSLVSTDGSFLEAAGVPPEDVVCTASLDTTYDIPTQIAAGGTAEAMFRRAFGDDPATWEAASPPRNVDPGDPVPSFHIVTRGRVERVDQARSFASILRDAGVPAELRVVRPLTHEEVNAAVGAAGDTIVTPALMEFFRACVGADTST